MEDIIIRPVITEKSMNDVAKGRFTFEVSMASTKKNIKKRIEERFKVNVISVKTNIVKGKKRRVGLRRTEKGLSSWKKSIVQLKEGQKIDLFDMGA